MQRLILAFAVALLVPACSKEECVQCIVEDDRGFIIESRVYCESNDRAREGFESGLKERYEGQPDTVNISCTDFENP